MTLKQPKLTNLQSGKPDSEFIGMEQILENASVANHVFDEFLLENQDELISKLTLLVQLGLTTYNPQSPEDFQIAQNNLIKRINGRKLEILYDLDSQPIAFGVYAADGDYFEISRIIHPRYQDKKLGKYFVISGCMQNPDIPYLVSTTQNQKAFFSIQSALGKENIISPNLVAGSFNPLHPENQGIVQGLTQTRQTDYRTNNGTLPDYYSQRNGLYSENINTENFPINTDGNADAILIVARNPFYNQNQNS